METRHTPHNRPAGTVVNSGNGNCRWDARTKETRMPGMPCTRRRTCTLLCDVIFSWGGSPSATRGSGVNRSTQNIEGTTRNWSQIDRNTQNPSGQKNERPRLECRKSGCRRTKRRRLTMEARAGRNMIWRAVGTLLLQRGAYIAAHKTHIPSKS